MRRGQVALYLLMTLVVLAMVVFMNVDAFLAVRAKNRVQNAGDAAALAAARVEGRLLNALGRLNLEHVAACVRGDAERVAAIANEQRRMTLLGPVEGLAEANDAAKRNGMEVNPDFSRLLLEHAATVRNVYAGGDGAPGDPYPEPWPGAWIEYACAIENAVSGGLAVGPDNCEFYDGLGGHLLLERNFYCAVAGENWCWFHFNAENVLNSYGSYRDWSPLPERRDADSIGGSEIFPLHVTLRKGPIEEVFSRSRLAEMLREFGDGEWDEEALVLEQEGPAAPALPLLADGEGEWTFFESSRWSQWFDGLRLAGDEEGWEFPLVGEVKPEYNVLGCASICRCVVECPSVVGSGSSRFPWAAAAKPFGTLAGEDGEGTVEPVTARSGFVLPAFNAVRLVPLDAVGGRDLATADAEWVDHVRKHLPAYLADGPTLRECFYCRQLVTWENAAFRASGVTWIKFHASTCRRGTGGAGSHGGTSHGH